MPLALTVKDSQIAPERYAERIQAEGRRFVRVSPIFVTEPLPATAQIYTMKGVTSAWPGTRVASDGKNVWPLTEEQVKQDFVERAHTDQLRDELVRFLGWLSVTTDDALMRLMAVREVDPAPEDEVAARVAVVEAFLNRRGA